MMPKSMLRFKTGRDPPHAHALRVLPWLTRCSCETATARIARNEVCVSVAGSVRSGASAISAVRAHTLSMGRDSHRATGATIIPTGMHVEIAVAKQAERSQCRSSLRRAEADSCTGLADCDTPAGDAEVWGSGPKTANQAHILSIGAGPSLLH